MKHLKSILITILLIYSGVSFAHTYNKQEVYFSAGVGFHKLQYTTRPGAASSDPGGVLGLGYTYFFHKNWGFVTGVEGAYYNTKLDSDEFTAVIKGLNDGQGHPFEFHSTVRYYSEKQKAYIVSIPLMITCQTGAFNRFYMMGGAKIGFPFGSYESAGTFINKGYFPEKNNWAIDQRFMGFGTFEGEKNGGKIKYNPSCMMALELGAKWYTGGNWSVYTGIYGEYGLNSIIKTSNKKEFITYQPHIQTTFTNGSVLLTEYMNNSDQGISFTGKVKPFSVGLRLRIAVGW